MKKAYYRFGRFLWREYWAGPDAWTFVFLLSFILILYFLGRVLPQ